MIPPNSLFSVLSFVSFLLAGLPLPWHMNPWHMGPCMYMLWTSLGCLILFVNSIVWNDNVANSAPVWCDISTRYLVGAGVGIPASSLCIIHRLYRMTTVQSISFRKEERRRAILFDLSIGIGFPCVVMTLQYVVQSHRFIIFEQVGCQPFMDDTLAVYFLITMWPLVIGLISLVYAVLTFRRAYRQNENLKKMHYAGFSISASRYWRLMALCCTEITFTVPLSIYVIVTNVFLGVDPWISWASIHSGFSFIPRVPVVLWENNFYEAIGVESSRWFFVLCALLIFGFFGWPAEARSFYSQVFRSVCRRLGLLKISSSPSLPITTPAHRPNQHHTVSTDLSVPVQARTRRYPLVSSVQFAAPPRRFSESFSHGVISNNHFSTCMGLSGDEGSVGSPPRLPSLNSLERYTKISWESLIPAQEPALCRDWRSLQDVSQSRLPSLSGLAHYTKISWESLLSTAEFSRGQQDVGQLV